jgi:hypothetical protein
LLESDDVVEYQEELDPELQEELQRELEPIRRKRNFAVGVRFPNLRTVFLCDTIQSVQNRFDGRSRISTELSPSRRTVFVNARKLQARCGTPKESDSEVKSESNGGLKWLVLIGRALEVDASTEFGLDRSFNELAIDSNSEIPAIESSETSFDDTSYASLPALSPRMKTSLRPDPTRSIHSGWRVVPLFRLARPIYVSKPNRPTSTSTVNPDFDLETDLPSSPKRRRALSISSSPKDDDDKPARERNLDPSSTVAIDQDQIERFLLRATQLGAANEMQSTIRHLLVSANVEHLIGKRSMFRYAGMRPSPYPLSSQWNVATSAVRPLYFVDTVRMAQILIQQVRIAVNIKA